MLIFHILKYIDKNDEESSDEENTYVDRDINTFPLNLNRFIKKQRVKRKRVVDTSKLLRMIDEIEETVHFKHIMS